MAKLTRTAGQTFDPQASFVYFTASNPDRQKYNVCHDHQLVAINELHGEGVLELLGHWLDQGKRLLIDSGIFWLSTSHAKTHQLRMDEALSLAPEEIDHFDELFQLYCQVIDTYGDRSWGYIELDQGMHPQALRPASSAAPGRALQTQSASFRVYVKETVTRIVPHPDATARRGHHVPLVSALMRGGFYISGGWAKIAKYIHLAKTNLRQEMVQTAL